MNEPKRLNDAPILDQISGQYEKFLLMVLRKYHPDGVVITAKDMQETLAATSAPDPVVLFTHGHKDSIEFKAIRTSVALKIAEHSEAMGSRRKQ